MQLIDGGVHSDARGVMRFCNDFDMVSVKRFYTIRNSASSPCRGWIMHKRETKWFFPLSGRTVLHVQADGCEQTVDVVLEADNPQVAKIPPCNWFMIEQDGSSEVQVFSDCHLSEFPNDDYRK